MDNITAINEVKTHLLENSCAMRHTFSEIDEPLRGKLYCKADSILFEAEDGNRPHLIVYLGDEYGHGNHRNILCKQFIETFSLESLQNEFITVCERKQQEAITREQQKEIDKVYFENLILKLKNIADFGVFEIRNYNVGTVLKWEIKTDRDNTYDYCFGRYWANFEANIVNGLIKIDFTIYGNGAGKTERLDGATESEFINFYTDKITECMEQYNKVMTYRDEADRYRQAEHDLQNLCYRIIASKKEYIFKTKKSAFCVRGKVKFSIRGEGKYQNIDGVKLYNLIKEKNITEYAEVPENQAAYLNDLKTLEFKAIA